MQPSVETLNDVDATDQGLLIHDPVDSAQFLLFTDPPAVPREVDPDRLPYPVETAVAITVNQLTIPKRNQLYIRTTKGDFIAEFGVASGKQYWEEPDNRLLDVSTTSLKLYLQVPGPFSIQGNDEAGNTIINVPDDSKLVVGVRSLHERPATTIETPLEPEPVMKAISASTSALKTMSCERSFPTLRGHPPRLKPAETLSIPESLEPASTDIRIRIPPDWNYIYPIAPLAWYLGADLHATADEPVLEVANWSFPLAADDHSFDARIHRVLKQIFFMDCLVRTEGLYPVDLHERQQVEEDLPIDLAELYDASLEHQVWSYLSVPYSVIQDHLPRWHLLVDVDPNAEQALTLPYLLDDFALLRCSSFKNRAAEMQASDVYGEFYRADTRSDGVMSESAPDDTFTPEPAPAMEHAYIGDGIPIASNKATLQSFERRLADGTSKSTRYITIQIVCNDPKMAGEDVVQDYYGIHELLEFDVDIAYELTKEELADHLQSDCDLLHYIGHINTEGFECADGRLDARDLSEVSVETFLLNACASYKQGRALIDAGAKAGVVTLSRVNNDGANQLGQTIARTLNAGFTLRSGLSIAEISAPAASQYVVLGDGGTQVVQCESGTPNLIDLIDVDFQSGASLVDFDIYSLPSHGQGPLWSPKCANDQYLVYGQTDRFSMNRSDLEDFLKKQSTPITCNGNLYWSRTLDDDQLEEILDRLAELRADGRRPIRFLHYYSGLSTEG